MSDDLPAVKRMGRPPMPPGERLKETLHFRVTAAEADTIDRGAVRSGLSVSDYLRTVLRRALVASNKSNVADPGPNLGA